MMKLWFVPFLALAIFSVTGCNEQELDDLAKAQDCLDKVNEAVPESASKCLQFTAGHTSQRAQILNCSIYLTAGGLTTTRMSDAYKASKDATITNKEASYMAYLALNKPDAAGGYTAAQNAQVYCNASRNTGLIFISSLAVMGSWANSIFAAGNGGASIDFSNPSSVESAVTTIINNCQGNPPVGSCDSAVIGAAATQAATVYCGTASADQSVCAQINSAVQTAGGNNDKITQGLMCLLAKKTYDPNAGTCTP